MEEHIGLKPSPYKIKTNLIKIEWTVSKNFTFLFLPTKLLINCFEIN